MIITSETLKHHHPITPLSSTESQKEASNKDHGGRVRCGLGTQTHSFIGRGAPSETGWYQGGKCRRARF